MTSRERVVRTLNREKVDRVPIDLGSHMSTGISAFTYWNLREKLGFPVEKVDMPDVVQCLARVETDVLERFHCDAVVVEPAWQHPEIWNPRGKYKFVVPAEMKPTLNKDGEWIVESGEASMRLPKNGFFFDGSWLSGWGIGSIDEQIALYAKEAERLFKETSYALHFVGYSFGMQFGAYFKGIDHAIQMIDDPDEALRMCERVSDQNIMMFDKINKAMGRYLNLISIGDDMGTQRGPLCRPDFIEEFSMPFYKKFCDHVHNTSDIKVFMHNCGSIKSLIPMIIEAGIDVLNPVQISADNMIPEELKREFGKDIIFWGGGCDTQHVLDSSSPEQVAEHVRGLVRTFKSDGGFVFNQVHNITGLVPPENVIAMFDAAYEESFY